MAVFLGRLAAAAVAHWKRSLLIVVLVLAGVAAISQAAGGSFSDNFRTSGTESQRATDLLSQRFRAQSGDTATLVFSVDRGTLRDGARPRAIADVVGQVARQPHVTSAANPLSPRVKGQVSRDGRIAFATVQYDQAANQMGSAPGKRLEGVSAVAKRAGIDVSRRGQVVDQAQQQSAPVGELIGVAVAVIVLTLVFGSASAMAITLVSAGIALAGGLMLLTLGSAFTNFPSFAPTLGVMLGLGAGIDYALLIVGRYREQLAAGDGVTEAARTASSTAGTSVVAAGAIVVLALSALLATGIAFVGRMGIGAAIVVGTVAVGAVTVLPVMMGAAARRLTPKDPKRLGISPRSVRWAQRVTARPWLAAGLGALMLLILATPFASLRLGQPDDGNAAAGSTTRVAYDKLAQGFGPGFNGPLVLAAAVPPGPKGQAALKRVERAVARTPDVAAVSPARLSQTGDAAAITVIPRSSPQDPSTSRLVKRLRNDVLPPAVGHSGLAVHVGGATATFQDLADRIAQRLPLFIALVVGLSILLLMVLFRSILVPLVSAAFNLLSILAAYGVVVAVFQWGWGASLLGVQSNVPIVSFVPLFMFALLFGLSMDYNVFLQSRIREEYQRGAAARDSVILGQSRVARIILAAGVIMTAVFLGFVTNPEVVVKTIGLGLAAAILIDVLIVRLILAPAVMTLLGDRAWWLPGWLDRLLPRVSLEGEEHGLAVEPSG